MQLEKLKTNAMNKCGRREFWTLPKDPLEDTALLIPRSLPVLPGELSFDILRPHSTHDASTPFRQPPQYSSRKPQTLNKSPILYS